MSSDEPDSIDTGLGIRQYRVSIMPWRSTRLRSWLRVFDNTYLHSKFYMQEDGRGAFPRSRVIILPSSARPQDYSTRRAVPCLPTNAYNPGWIQQLHPVEVENLNRHSDYDFVHDEDMLL